MDTHDTHELNPHTVTLLLQAESHYTAASSACCVSLAIELHVSLSLFLPLRLSRCVLPFVSVTAAAFRLMAEHRPMLAAG